jgi:hypothetical protein
LVSIPLAPPALRNLVYRKLIGLSPASFNYEVMNGRGGLRARGIDDFSQYGCLPKTVSERTALVESLIKEVRYELGRTTSLFAGIPGFWMDANGETRLWSKFDSNDELMLVPFVGRDGLIRACQIRVMRFVENRSGNYLWLSSAREAMGCGPGSPLHHANPESYSGKSVLVTEGALKAATVQKFLTERYVVGNGGVATSHWEIVETARQRPLEIAFDNDSFTNPHVARAMAALIRLRHSDQNSFAYSEEVRITTWDRSLKGIDEALLAGVQLQHLTIAEWLNSLRPECLEHAIQQLSSVGRKEAVGKQRHEQA